MDNSHSISDVSLTVRELEPVGAFKSSAHYRKVMLTQTASVIDAKWTTLGVSEADDRRNTSSPFEELYNRLKNEIQSFNETVQKVHSFGDSETIRNLVSDANDALGDFHQMNGNTYPDITKRLENFKEVARKLDAEKNKLAPVAHTQEADQSWSPAAGHDNDEQGVWILSPVDISLTMFL